LIIQALKKNFPVTTLCQALGIHRSSFRYWSERSKRVRPERLQELEMVKTIFKESNGSAGARTVATIASSRNTPLSRYRAGRLMKQCQLRSRQQPKHAYKPAWQDHAAVPNKLNRRFNCKAPNQAWCGDVTFSRSGKGWVYLAIVMDLYARKPIGWAISKTPNSKLTADALNMAFISRGNPSNVLFHSDQGCHYTSKEFRDYLLRYEIEQSMSRKGNCWDNAPMERFFRSLKSEWVPRNGYRSIADAKAGIINYIIGYYSQVRPHTHNGGLAPNAAEAKYWKTSYPVAKYT